MISAMRCVRRLPKAFGAARIVVERLGRCNAASLGPPGTPRCSPRVRKYTARSGLCAHTVGCMPTEYKGYLTRFVNARTR
jgi:hypothetical protein